MHERVRCALERVRHLDDHEDARMRLSPFVDQGAMDRTQRRVRFTLERDHAMGSPEKRVDVLRGTAAPYGSAQRHGARVLARGAEHERCRAPNLDADRARRTPRIEQAGVEDRLLDAVRDVIGGRHELEQTRQVGAVLDGRPYRSDDLVGVALGGIGARRNRCPAASGARDRGLDGIARGLGDLDCQLGMARDELDHGLTCGAQIPGELGAHLVLYERRGASREHSLRADAHHGPQERLRRIGAQHLVQRLSGAGRVPRGELGAS